MTKSYIEWIPLSKRKPEPFTRVMVTFRESIDVSNTAYGIHEPRIQDTIYTATFYDDGIERHICFDDTNRPKKYYFEFDDGFRSKIGLKKEVFDNPRSRITYEVTAWAKLPEPYHKKTRRTCPVKDISAFLDQLDNDDRNHLKKEDRE